MKKLFTLLAILSLFGCEKKAEKVTHREDYDQYLSSSNNASTEQNLEQLQFWQARFKNDSTNLLEMAKLAGIHGALFGTTGDIMELKTQEILLKKAHDVSARNKDSYLRSIAHNYISQHRFKEAQVLLDSAYTFPDDKRLNEYMLFDVAMELGEYERADTLLGKIKDPKDFNYLIRLAKWSDHQGNLDAAIKYMEQAKQIAEERDNRGLKLWVYSNIGDFYGHAGRINDSYNSYMKTLQLEPDNHYVKKQLAWMVYSYEKDTKEANRILDSIMVNHKAPDYYLLKADMAEYEGNEAEAIKQRDKFIKAVDRPEYGGMYNTYLIELYSETNPQKALTLAQKEITNRATPETYQLLAYSQLMNGDKEAALKTIREHVEGKTDEPKALFHAALIFKANGMDEKVSEIKSELQSAYYELGPLKAKRIEKF